MAAVSKLSVFRCLYVLDPRKPRFVTVELTRHTLKGSSFQIHEGSFSEKASQIIFVHKNARPSHHAGYASDAGIEHTCDSEPNQELALLVRGPGSFWASNS